mgnify:CR=1 FL=1
MNRWISILLVLAAAGGLYGAGRLNDRLLQARRTYGITQADPLVNAPPLVAFTTVALGGFRGIIADILWVRSSRLQEEGRYFELVQLADWITKLEPRFTAVWAFHGWNLAYNISVLFQQPEDRWRWVRHGVHLLRDEGLLYNPGDARLLYELGWLFQHKISGSSDNAHRYYKQAWAAEMMQLFEGPQPDYGPLAMAAPDRATLLRRPGVAALVAQLEQAGRDPFSWERAREARAASPDDLLNTAAGRELVDHLRLRRMIDVYKLDPALMREVDAECGPLDWRLPQAHAIYWGWQSRRIATDEFDRLSAERMVFQSLADSFRQGSLFLDPQRELFLPSPNLALVPRVEAAFLKAIQEYPEQDSLRVAHGNFLREAILTLYSYNRTREARQLFDELTQRYPSDETARGFAPYVLHAFARNVKDLTDRDAQAVVEGALYQSLYWQALGESDRAAGFDQLARLCWETYMAPRQDNAEFKERTGLPPISELRTLARERVSETLGGLR